MSDLNEFVHSGRQSNGISMPSSFVRPVSLERIRGFSASKNQEASPMNDKLISSRNGPLSNRSNLQSGSKQLCQNIIQKKLFGATMNHLKGIKSNLRSDLLHKEHGRRQQKRAQKIKESENNQLKDCTFKPKTLVQGCQKRSLQQFLDSQNNHSKKTANKLQLIRKQLDKEKIKEATFRPAINKQIPVKGQNKENIHCRLYQLSKSKDKDRQEMNSGMSSRQQSKKKVQKIVESPRQQRPPSISKSSSISNFRPLSHNNSIPNIPRVPSMKSIDRSKASSNNIANTPRIVSINTQKQLIKKVIRELSIACQSLAIFDQMNYLEFSNLMMALKFINQQAVDRSCLHNLWTMLEVEGKEYIYTHNLCKAICSIMGLHNYQIIEREMESSQQPILQKPQYFESDSYCNSSRSKHITMKEGIIFFTEKESKEFKKQFQLLYINRLNEDTPKEVTTQKHSFRPIISEASKELAEKRRTKILEQTIQMLKNNEIEYQIQESGQISHADYLILQKKAQDFKLNKMKQEKQALEEEEIETLLRHQQHQIHNSTNSQRYLDLYAMGSLNKDKRDRTSDEIQLQRYRDDLTFRPNVHKGSTDKFQPVAKDIDKAIFRMYEGRKLRDGEDSTEKVAKKSPLLYLNINIDNKQTQRLQIFENDDPHELAFRFGNKFGLNPEAKKRLSQLILSELKQLI